MAQMNTTAMPEHTGGRQRAGVTRLVKHTMKIDMTPMVDLGFLLITFFVITARLAEPRAMEIYHPKDGPPTELGNSNALTILQGNNNRLYYYEGNWEEAVQKGDIHPINYAGDNSLRKIIVRKKAALDANPNSKEKSKGLMLLIKPTSGTSYKNMVAVLDEVFIDKVEKYALIKISPEETAWLASH